MAIRRVFLVDPRRETAREIPGWSSTPRAVWRILQKEEEGSALGIERPAGFAGPQWEEAKPCKVECCFLGGARDEIELAIIDPLDEEEIATVVSGEDAAAVALGAPTG